MSVDKEYGKYYIECDTCGNYIPGFKDFQDALDYMKQSKWTTKKVMGEWEHYCVECNGTIKYE